MKMEYSRFVLRKCREQDIVNIMAFQKEIIEGLDNKELLRENSRTMFEQCIAEPDLTLGVFDGIELVAIVIFVNERGSIEDLSIGLEKHVVDAAANMKLVMVKEEYRGNEFQKALMWIVEKHAYNRGITHLCTTVSKDNKYSLKNIWESGYEYDQSTIKYGGLSRELYVKNITQSVSVYNKNILTVIHSLEDRSEPNALIMEGVNLNRCFQGDISIANTGDVLEYEDTDSGNTFYGLYFKKFTPMVMVFIPEKRSLQLVDFSERINCLKLQKVWINAIGGF